MINPDNPIMQKFLKDNFSTQIDIDSFVMSFFRKYTASQITQENLEQHLNWLNGMYDLEAASEDD